MDKKSSTQKIGIYQKQDSPPTPTNSVVIKGEALEGGSDTPDTISIDWEKFPQIEEFCSAFKISKREVIGYLLRESIYQALNKLNPDNFKAECKKILKREFLAGNIKTLDLKKAQKLNKLTATDVAIFRRDKKTYDNLF